MGNDASVFTLIVNESITKIFPFSGNSFPISGQFFLKNYLFPYLNWSEAWHTDCLLKLPKDTALNCTQIQGTMGGRMVSRIFLSKRAQKDLKKVPNFIRDKLESWVKSVNEIGLEEVRKIQGYHDEALKGKRKGQRSIRLNHSYRAIYCIMHNGTIEFVSIEEVNKHEY